MLSLPIYALPIIVLGCIAAGFVVGLLIERKHWNDLIEAGVLPRPQRPRRPD